MECKVNIKSVIAICLMFYLSMISLVILNNSNQSIKSYMKCIIMTIICLIYKYPCNCGEAVIKYYLRGLNRKEGFIYVN